MVAHLSRSARYDLDTVAAAVIVFVDDPVVRHAVRAVTHRQQVQTIEEDALRYDLVRKQLLFKGAVSSGIERDDKLILSAKNDPAVAVECHRNNAACVLGPIHFFHGEALGHREAIRVEPVAVLKADQNATEQQHRRNLRFTQ